MATKITVTKLTKAEAYDILSIERDNQNINDRLFINKLLEWDFEDEEHKLTFALKIDDHIGVDPMAKITIGYVSARFSYGDTISNNGIYIDYIYIVEDMRGNGFGKLIIDHLKVYKKDIYLNCWNKHRQFFIDNGFYDTNEKEEMLCLRVVPPPSQRNYIPAV